MSIPLLGSLGADFFAGTLPISHIAVPRRVLGDASAATWVAVGGRRRPLIPMEGDHPFRLEGDHFLALSRNGWSGSPGKVVVFARNRARRER